MPAPCPHPSRKALCEICRAEHNAPEFEDYDCPGCGGLTSAEDSLCANCRRDGGDGDDL